MLCVVLRVFREGNPNFLGPSISQQKNFLYLKLWKTFFLKVFLKVKEIEIRRETVQNF